MDVIFIILLVLWFGFGCVMYVFCCNLLFICFVYRLFWLFEVYLIDILFLLCVVVVISIFKNMFGLWIFKGKEKGMIFI